ncbi:hypothetical protein NBRC116592_11690 [Colwellia sp. KU-HH00111]|uniref:gluconate 2-dehydrogenase subunit 3 family protein n=1 Tax=Colwellia sp. KU-HH00111 TaxID=3127652 RepID=UPI003102D99E
MKSFFDKTYKTPLWFKEKRQRQKDSTATRMNSNLSRRMFLKSAAGAGAIGVSSGMILPALASTAPDKNILQRLLTKDPWLTLEATLMHLLPESTHKPRSGPSAKDIDALAYLYQVVTVQPIDQDEKDFIIKGVSWLNGYAHSQLDKPFVKLSSDEKEIILRGISQSRAGENWLATLLAYIFEAMLAPPAYGGNPNGVGWHWLEHQPGFPLPKAGQRYFELPQRGKAHQELAISSGNAIPIKEQHNNQQLASSLPLKTSSIKRINKA